MGKRADACGGGCARSGGGRGDGWGAFDAGRTEGVGAAEGVGITVGVSLSAGSARGTERRWRPGGDQESTLEGVAAHAVRMLDDCSGFTKWIVGET